jgi:hypothetical protein
MLGDDGTTGAGVASSVGGRVGSTGKAVVGVSVVGIGVGIGVGM